MKETIIETQSNITNSGKADYLLLPSEVKKKFKTDQWPLDFEMKVGVDEKGRMVIVATRKSAVEQEDMYDFE